MTGNALFNSKLHCKVSKNLKLITRLGLNKRVNRRAAGRGVESEL